MVPKPNRDENPRHGMPQPIWINDTFVSPEQFMMATALMELCEDEEHALKAIQAVQALRQFIACGALPPDRETSSWNRKYQIGQAVSVYSKSAGGEAFLTRTKSPALNTSWGPVILVEHHERAVLLQDVEPSHLNFAD